jgi:cytochrome c peroxidase
MKIHVLGIIGLLAGVACLSCREPERLEVMASPPPSEGISDTLLPQGPAHIQTCTQTGQIVLLSGTQPWLDLLAKDTLKVRRRIRLPAVSSGVSLDGDTAYVTIGESLGRLLQIDLATGAIRYQWEAGHFPMAPILHPLKDRLYVANRFEHQVREIHLVTGVQRRVAVVREPVALVLNRDGSRLYVANHLPEVRPFLDEEAPFMAAEISVIDTQQWRVTHTVELSNGSQGLRGMAVSPDGRFVVVSHVLSHYAVPTTHIEQGAMNMNAISLIETAGPSWFETVVLDDPNQGAANPWALGFSADGQQLFVTHAGTHELSVIDFPALVSRLEDKPGALGYYGAEDLLTLHGIRQRIRLPILGARAMLIDGSRLCMPGYFSDTMAVVDLEAVPPVVRDVVWGDKSQMSPQRLGEQYFNDATLCFQQWQSCASCHPDGRSDALYWDLLNDGVGNTKNTKSLLMSAWTPPVMWRGVRQDAAAAIQAGIHHIQFAESLPGQAEALEAYLRSMTPVPSPSLNAGVLDTVSAEEPLCATCHVGKTRGTLTEAARRGKVIFEGKAGCVQCHPHPFFTTGQQVDPGLGSGVVYDIPSLIEVWRTAPYLHSSDALTLRETITDFNLMQQRGHTRDLTEQELDDLLAYLKSL